MIQNKNTKVWNIAALQNAEVNKLFRWRISLNLNLKFVVAVKIEYSSLKLSGRKSSFDVRVWGCKRAETVPNS